MLGRRIRGRQILRWLNGRYSTARLLRLRDRDRTQLLWTAYQQTRKGNLDPARRAYELILLLWNDDAQALLGLAYCLVRLGQPREAEEKLTQLLLREPAHRHALLDRAEVRHSLNDVSGATSDLDAFEKTAPDKHETEALARRAEGLRAAVGRGTISSAAPI